MTKLTRLPYWQQTQVDTLQADMQAARCVFDFAVFQAADFTGADVDLHRSALQNFCEQLVQRAQAYLNQVRKQNPEMVLQDVSTDFNTQLATPIRVKPELLSALLDTTPYTFEKHDYHSFFQSFYDPPYTTSWTEAQRIPIFEKWCRLIGLTPEDQPEVIDWVHDPSQKIENFPDDLAGRCAWNDYFEAGLEWWGVWCFTIWNPKQQTLAVVMASATD
jgi:hypothetical protein